MDDPSENYKRLDQDSSESEDSEDAGQDMYYQGVKKESLYAKKD